jgi:hypothetical protein
MQDSGQVRWVEAALVHVCSNCGALIQPGMKFARYAEMQPQNSFGRRPRVLRDCCEACGRSHEASTEPKEMVS